MNDFCENIVKFVKYNPNTHNNSDYAESIR